MNDEEIKNEIRKFALQNAAEHEGQTRDKTILAKIMGNVPELRQKAKEISPIITEIVSEINQIPLEKQQKEIQEKYPELLEIKKEKPQKESTFTSFKKYRRERNHYKISSCTKWISTHRSCKGCHN